MTKRRKLMVAVATMTALALVFAACGGGGADSGDDGKKKVFVALSYSGNAWQDEAANLALSIARTPPYDQQAEVTKQIAGTEVQDQISQYQSMIADGADAIVSFPVSPTALNGVIRQGCEQGVKFFMYDATVTEPCAWNVSYITATKEDDPSAAFFGAETAKALVQLLDGDGDIFMSRGVPGNSVDQTHYQTAKAVFDDSPGINIVAEYYGLWDGATTQQETAKALAAQPGVDGIWAEAGEAGALKALEAEGKQIPVTGENSNYFRLALSNGWPGVSSGSPPMTAGVAMKIALEVLEEGDDAVPKNIEIPLPWVPAEDVKLCEGDEFVEGCNAFPSGKVPDEFVTEVFSPDLLPESSLTAAQTGRPTPGVEVEPLPDMEQYEQPPERRFVTRSSCDEGWKEGGLPSGVTGCIEE